MADEETKLTNKKKKETIKPIVPKTAVDLQRLQYEKLMKDPDKNVPIPEKRKEWKPTDPKDFVRFVMGSSAGAGSGEFHVYRATRRRENNRTEYLEREAKQEAENEDYKKKLEENKLKAEEKTAKKRAKRQRKKQKKNLAKKKKELENKQGDTKEQETSEEEEEEEEEDEEEPHFTIHRQ
ncbi:PRKR-interacting protein 1 [Exaiptasia diaphana]|nr:PRKR-interacting protein 1 [Exaiptasia diaphana]